jgi:HK97 family phage major capsid protein
MPYDLSPEPAPQWEPLAGSPFPSTAGQRVGKWLRAAFLGDSVAMRWCGVHTVPVLRAQHEGGDIPGGFLVPQEIERQIVAVRDVAGVFRQNARVIPMGSDERTIPRRTGGVTAYFVGENAQIAESQASWDNISFVAKKIGALTRISGELQEDSAAELGQYFIDEMGFAFAASEDACGFVGDGTGAYGGILGICPQLLDGTHTAGAVNAASGHDTFAELDTADIAALMAALPGQHWPGAKFYCSGYAAAQTFVRLGAVPVGLAAAGTRPMLQYAGVPIVMTPHLPGAGSQSGAVMLLFGDLRSAAALGDRRGMVVQSSMSRYIELDQVAIRGTERFDIVCHSLGDNTTAGAVVGLVGA